MDKETKITNKLSEIFGLPQSQEAIDKRKKRILIPLGALALAGSLAVVGHEVIASDELHFSEKTHSYVMKSGEGLWNAADDIKDIEHIDKREAVYQIEHDPANAKALSDGLQVGESIQVPDSVETK